MEIRELSQKQAGFLLIEVLVALAIFVLVVKATLLMHVAIVAMQQSMCKRMQALEYSSKSIELVKTGALLHDHRPFTHDDNQKKHFTVMHEAVSTNFFVTSEKGKAMFCKDGKHITKLCTRLTVKWDSLRKKCQTLALVNG